MADHPLFEKKTTQKAVHTFQKFVDPDGNEVRLYI